MKKKLTIILSLLLCLTLTACGTTLGENTKVFFSEMGEVVDVWTSANNTSKKTESTEGSAEKLTSVSDFTVTDDGNYSFTGTSDATYYVVTVCDSSATDDSDTYLYSSNRIDEDGSGTYSGNLYEMFTINYGKYLVKCFAYPEIGDDTHSRSAATTATLTVTGELLEPQVEYFWNCYDNTLTLQLANTASYSETCLPDTVDIVITGEDGASQSLTMEAPDASNNSIQATGLTAGSYSITAQAHSSNEYLTAADTAVVTVATDVEIANDNLVSSAYSYTNKGLGHGYSWPVGTKSYNPTATSSLGSYNGTDFVTEPADSTRGTTDKSVYSAEFSFAVGFGESGWLELYSDGTCAAYNDTSGPVSASKVTGTWYMNDDEETITINWDMDSVEVIVG